MHYKMNRKEIDSKTKEIIKWCNDNLNFISTLEDDMFFLWKNEQKNMTQADFEEYCKNVGVDCPYKMKDLFKKSVYKNIKW